MHDENALAVLFRLPFPDAGLFVVATATAPAQIFVGQRVERPLGFGPAVYEPQPMNERVREQLLACGFTPDQLIP